MKGGAYKDEGLSSFVPGSTFTDDTVLTVAVAESLLLRRDYVDSLHEYFHAYPAAGYGGTFFRWAGYRKREPYNSWGNGSAMSAPSRMCMRRLRMFWRKPNGAPNKLTTTNMESAAPKQLRPRYSLLVPGTARSKSADMLRTHSAIFWMKPWQIYGQRITSTYRAKGPYHSRLSRSWSRIATRTLFAMRFRSAATQIQWPASRAGSLRHSTAAYPRTLAPQVLALQTSACGEWRRGSSSDSCTAMPKVTYAPPPDMLSPTPPCSSAITPIKVRQGGDIIRMRQQRLSAVCVAQLFQAVPRHRQVAPAEVSLSHKAKYLRVRLAQHRPFRRPMDVKAVNDLIVLLAGQQTTHFAEYAVRIFVPFFFPMGPTRSAIGLAPDSPPATRRPLRRSRWHSAVCWRP